LAPLRSHTRVTSPFCRDRGPGETSVRHLRASRLPVPAVSLAQRRNCNTAASAPNAGLVMRFLAVVPARLAAQRFPQKLLALLDGTPLLVHTVARASRARLPSQVVVATDSEHLDAAIRSGPIPPAAHVVCVRTPDVGIHSGTQRVAHAVRRLVAPEDRADCYVCNVQADQPALDPRHVDAVLKLAVQAGRENPGGFNVATLCTPIRSEAEFHDPCAVKCVSNAKGEALYFSRAAVPFERDASAGRRVVGFDAAGVRAPLRHLGLYAFSAETLVNEILPTGRSWLEEAEKLEQLSWLYHGARVRVGVVESAAHSVDTPFDVDRAERELSTLNTS
jgi:3-deoxy-manno-octulosonate cytidylyltransferase (CMP-KDO synthetase)